MLAKGGFPADLPTVTHDGVTYIDLRGFPFEAEIMADVKRVDLSDSNLEHGGVGKKVLFCDCLFRGARLWTVVGYDVRRCDFDAAQMKGADLRGEFHDCVFTNANLVGAKNMGTVSRFIRCDFRNAKLRNAQLRDAVFDHCLWEDATIGSGSFAGSRFIGGRPTLQQFGDAILETDVDDDLEKQIEAEASAKHRKQKR